MRARSLAALLLAPTLISVIAPAAQAATADPYDLLYIEGQAGDNLTPSSARTQTLVSPTHVAVVTPVGAGIKVAMKRVSDATMAVQTVTVVPPTGSALTTGGPFGTTKTATADTWGLEVRSSSTCSASTGHVTIHELVLDPADSHVTSIALSYDQTCSAVGSKPVYGDVRVQSTRDYRTAAANATTLGFAGTILATTAAAKTVTVTAGGTTALATGPATLTGDSAADYAISDDTCAPAPVAPASTCTVSVTFTPSTRGAHPAVLHIPDGTAHGERTVTLAGLGWELPAAPTALTARVASNGIALKWNATTDDGGAPPVQYRILRGEPGGTLNQLGVSSVTNTADVVSPTTLDDHDYEYAVQAVSGAGASPASTSVIAHTPSAASDPTGLPQAIAVDAPAGAQFPRTSQVVVPAPGASFPTSQPGRRFVSVGAYQTTYLLALRAPLGEEVRPGTFVTGANNDSNWFMTLVKQGASCTGTPSGSVTVNDAQFTATDELAVLDADFTWTCDDRPAIRGSVRFHSSRSYTGVVITTPTTVLVSGIAPVTLDNVVYRNAGTTPITVSAVELAPDDLAGYPATPQSDWTIIGQTCAGVVLAPSDTCTATVQLNASALGERRVVVRFLDSTALGSQERMLDVLARGLPPAATHFNPVYSSVSALPLSWSTDSVDPNTSPEHWHLYKGSSATSLSPLATVDSPNYQDTDVSQSVRYYQLQAETVAGLGPMSQVFMVDTRLTPPTAVTTSSLARRVGFTWAAPTATTPLQLTGYAVYTGSTATALTRSVTTNTVATVRNLAPGAKVYFKVAALYGSTEGPASAVTSVTAGSAQVVAVSQLDQLIALPAGGGTGIPFSTPGLQYVMTPSVSRDGRWITFSAAVCDSCPNQIFVLAYDGASAPRQVTHNQDEEADPTFSADGKTIAFDASPDMYSIPHLATVATAGGTAVTRPGSTGLVDPSYLGSSTTLVATDLTSATAPLRRITTTGAKTSIAGTTNGYQPAVSPDGTKVAYLVSMPDDSDLIRMTVISTGASSSQPMAAVGYIYGPSWSFDAKSFSYSVEPLTSGVSRVWTTLVGTSTHKALSGLDLSLYDPATDSPDYTAPAVKITAPTTTSTTATSVKVAWAATDLQAGVLTSDVRYRKAKGTGALTGYVVPSGWTGTTATYKTLAVAKGYRYCFSVRSKDRDSNISAWTAERCITVK